MSKEFWPQWALLMLIGSVSFQLSMQAAAERLRSVSPATWNDLFQPTLKLFFTSSKDLARELLSYSKLRGFVLWKSKYRELKDRWLTVWVWSCRLSFACFALALVALVMSLV